MSIDPQSVSRFQKERYLRSLSEDDFRDIVIRPLFLRLGYRDGRDTCGPAEQGKDALFTEVDNLGISHVVAVQTKAGNLNLASKASQNIVDATTQLRTALETPIPLLTTRSRCLPSKVFLCASGKINDAAKGYILEQIKDPRINFLDINDLIPRLDSALPEIWYGIDAEILPYFRAIKAYVDGQQGKGDHGRPDVLAGASSNAGYVALNIYRAKTKTIKIRGKALVDTEIEELPFTGLIGKRDSKTLVLGDAGMGKTTALYRIAYIIAQRGVSSSTSYLIPVVVRATEIHAAGDSPLQQITDDVARRFAGTSKPVFTANDLSGGRVLLLIDAIDEIPTREGRAQIIGVLDAFSRLYPACRVIATGRPYRDLLGVPGYATYYVSPISWRQAEKIVRAMEKGHKLPAERTNEILRRLEHIHGLELNPLLVAVFAATSEYSRQDIPANITELFKKYTELMLGRWDEQKGFAQQYQAPLKDFLLQKIALYMHEHQNTMISPAKLRELITYELRVRGHAANVAQIIDELLYRSGLFRVVDEEIAFRHHLIQEFFAGRGIPSVDFIKTVVGQEWWKRPIVFYFGENPGQVSTLKEVFSAVPRNPDPEVFEATTTLGLALQACYLSEVTEKIEIWRGVVSSLALTNTGLLQHTSSDAKYPLALFTGYYLYGRDSVALANIREELKKLTVWAQTPQDSVERAEEQEGRLFWLIAALLELGDVESARELAREFNPGKGEYLLGLFLGARLLQEVRSTSEHQQREAERFAADLERRIGPLLGKLRTEFNSHLLEFREGKVEVVDPEKENTKKPWD